jgi:hypothetical protein
MATEKNPLKKSSRELLALFLLPGSARTPLLNVDEIKEILESPQAEEKPEGKAPPRRDDPNETPRDH